jgi:hypothetical protein
MVTTAAAGTAWERVRLDARRGPSRVLFGRMYEDASIEREAFPPGGRVFCIASAGCTAMALAPHHEVVAADINPAQLASAERRFGGERCVRGTAERVMALGRAVAPAAGWHSSTVREFLDLGDPTEQVSYWVRYLDTRRFRVAIDTLFSLTSLRAVYAPAFLDFLPPRMGAVMRGRMERCFARHANRTNPYARALLLGELSNILDGAGAEYERRLLAAVKRAAARDAVVVLRSFRETRMETSTNRAAADRAMLWGIVDVRPASNW